MGLVWMGELWIFVILDDGSDVEGFVVGKGCTPSRSSAGVPGPLREWAGGFETRPYVAAC